MGCCQDSSFRFEFVCLFVCLLICLFLYLFVCLFICLFFISGFRSDTVCVVSRDIFESLAVFWRARRASQNARDE